MDEYIKGHCCVWLADDNEELKKNEGRFSATSLFIFIFLVRKGKEVLFLQVGRRGRCGYARSTPGKNRACRVLFFLLSSRVGVTCDVGVLFFLLICCFLTVLDQTSTDFDTDDVYEGLYTPSPPSPTGV